jgi:hypothetical protein
MTWSVKSASACVTHMGGLMRKTFPERPPFPINSFMSLQSSLKVMTSWEGLRKLSKHNLNNNCCDRWEFLWSKIQHIGFYLDLKQYLAHIFFSRLHVLILMNTNKKYTPFGSTYLLTTHLIILSKVLIILSTTFDEVIFTNAIGHLTSSKVKF